MDNTTERVPTMDELRTRIREKDAEILAKLVGKTVVWETSEWDVNRQVYRTFYDIKAILSVELEYEPHKAVILNFTKGDSTMLLNLEQFDRFSCKIGEYGSIREYLESNGFSLFN